MISEDNSGPRPKLELCGWRHCRRGVPCDDCLKALSERNVRRVRCHSTCSYDGPSFKFEGSDLEWEYDPLDGNVGRGFRDIHPEQISAIFMYKPYLSIGTDGVSADIRLVNDPGWIWNGYVREEHGKHYVIAFERKEDSVPFVIPERPDHYWGINDLPEEIREDFQRMMESADSPIIGSIVDR